MIALLYFHAGLLAKRKKKKTDKQNFYTSLSYKHFIDEHILHTLQAQKRQLPNPSQQ